MGMEDGDGDGDGDGVQLPIFEEIVLKPFVEDVPVSMCFFTIFLSPKLTHLICILLGYNALRTIHFFTRHTCGSIRTQ